jgi:uncharacterized membrane protein
VKLYGFGKRRWQRYFWKTHDLQEINVATGRSKMMSGSDADVAALWSNTTMASMPMGREESRARANEASYLADSIGSD